MSKWRGSLAILACVAGLAATGCSNLEPWERGVHSLTPMGLDGPACQRFETNVEVYREGAAGANGGKSGGGCGCT